MNELNGHGTSSNCHIDSCDIYGNSDYGIYSVSPDTIVAHNVWWGSVKGPRYSGSAVDSSTYQEIIYGAIDYTPWALQSNFPEEWDSLKSLLPYGSTGVYDRIEQQTQADDIMSVTPNPFTKELIITVGKNTTAAHVEIYSIHGSLIRQLAVGKSGKTAWDGSDSNGLKVEKGIYVVKMQQGAKYSTRRVTLLR